MEEIGTEAVEGYEQGRWGEERGAVAEGLGRVGCRAITMVPCGIVRAIEEGGESPSDDCEYQSEPAILPCSCLWQRGKSARLDNHDNSLSIRQTHRS